MFLLLRFNIAANRVYEAKDAGKLGFAELLVWLRSVASRQLLWNKNSYNAKLRYNSCVQDICRMHLYIFNLNFNMFLPSYSFFG